MRETKFRAWNLKYNCWHYFHVPENFFNKPSCKQGEVHWLDYEKWYEYTGLKDKNGKEIYEGDILSGVERPLPVEWGIGGFMVGYYAESLGDFLLSGKPKKVIGNIYENPEFLKEQK